MRNWTAILLILPLLMLAACDSADPDVTPTSETEGLTPQQVGVIDDLPDATLDLEGMLLPNGRTIAEYLDTWGYPLEPQGRDGFPAGEMAFRTDLEAGPQDQKNLVIALMSRGAIHLTDRSRHSFAEQSAQDGAARPAQSGIGYVWGSKDYTVRSMPPATDGQGEPFNPPSCRDHLIHGVDASGFLTYLANGAGFTMATATDAHTQSLPATWNEMFLANGLDKISVEPVDLDSPDDLEPGDFVYWTDDTGTARHVAFVGRDGDGNTAIFQSSGSRHDTCEKNFGPERGPRQIDAASEWFDGTLGTWHANRIVTDISGSWGMMLRCAGQTVNAFEFDFTIQTTDQDETVSVEGYGAGMDYTGDPMEVNLEGTYTSAINTLYAQLHFTWDEFDPETYYRIDEFTKRLDEDDTGFFPIERVEQEPGQGCAAEVRLVNLESAPPPAPRPVTERTVDGVSLR